MLASSPLDAEALAATLVRSLRTAPVTSRLCVRTTTIVLAASIAFAHPAAAAETFIRDTEIEADIQTMVTPIWKVAGLERSPPDGGE